MCVCVGGGGGGGGGGSSQVFVEKVFLKAYDFTLLVFRL